MTRADKALNTPILCGTAQILVADTKPERGVELSVGLSSTAEHDITAWLTAENAYDLGLALMVASGHQAQYDRKHGR